MEPHTDDDIGCRLHCHLVFRRVRAAEDGGPGAPVHRGQHPQCCRRVVLGAVRRGLEGDEDNTGVVHLDQTVELFGQAGNEAIPRPGANPDCYQRLPFGNVLVGEDLQPDFSVCGHPEHRIGGHRHAVEPEFSEETG